MRDLAFGDQLDLADLGFSDWLDRLAQVDSDDVFVEFLGKNHGAILQDHGTSLIVTFEKYAEIAQRQKKGHPLSWDIAGQIGWSSLTIVCDTFDWFRSPHVYAYFDRLVDEGTLDQYDRVIFLGVDETSHAAAVYSVVATVAEVVLIGPIATQARDIANWDQRYPAARRLDFATRYAYGPDLVETAKKVTVIYNQSNPTEAMHATLYKSVSTEHVGMRLLSMPWRSLTSAQFLSAALNLLAEDDAKVQLCKLMRARRENPDYLRSLLRMTIARNRPDLTRKVCTYTLRKFPNAPHFKKALEDLDKI